MQLKTVFIIISNLLVFNDGLRRTAYYTRERSGVSLTDIPDDEFSNLTHLIYSFGYLNTKTNQAQVTHNVLTQDKSVLTGDLNRLFELKRKYRHLHTGISISGLFGDILFTKRGVNGLVRSIIELIDNFGLDFIDLDWEFPVIGDEVDSLGSTNDPQTFLTLVRAIQYEFKLYKNQFKPQLSIALPCPWYYLQYYNIENLHPYLDMIHVMSYDFNTPAGNLIYHQSNLYSNPLISTTSIHNTTQYLLSLGIPSNKIILGIPAYAYTFPIKDPNQFKLGQPFIGRNTSDKFSQTLLRTLPPTYQSQHLQFDNVTKSSYLIDTDQNQFISLDTPQSTQYKLDYIQSNQLGGIFLWALTWETEGNPLLSIFNQLEVINHLNHLHYPNSQFKNIAKLNDTPSNQIPSSLTLILGLIITVNLL